MYIYIINIIAINVNHHLSPLFTPINPLTIDHHSSPPLKPSSPLLATIMTHSFKTSRKARPRYRMPPWRRRQVRRRLARLAAPGRGAARGGAGHGGNLTVPLICGEKVSCK